MTRYAEAITDNQIALPEESCRKLKLRKGMKLKLLTDDESILVLKLVGNTQIDEASLFLQQQALAKIWDNPAEDIYDL